MQALKLDTYYKLETCARSEEALMRYQSLIKVICFIHVPT